MSSATKITSNHANTNNRKIINIDFEFTSCHIRSSVESLPDFAQRLSTDDHYEEYVFFLWTDLEDKRRLNRPPTDQFVLMID